MDENLTDTRRIVLIDEQWLELKKANGLHTEKALAGALGISEVTLWRIRKGHGYPGETFILKALSLFPGYEFKDLFEIKTVA